MTFTVCELQDSGIPAHEESPWVVAVAKMTPEKITISYYSVGRIGNGGNPQDIPVTLGHRDRGLRVTMENGDDSFVFLNTRGPAYIAYHLPTPVKTLRVDPKSQKGTFSPSHMWWETVNEAGETEYVDFEIPEFRNLPY